MKSSPDVSSINQDALFLTTKATVSCSLMLNHRFTEQLLTYQLIHLLLLTGISSPLANCTCSCCRFSQGST